MALADDLVLITTDPRKGTSLLGSTETDPVVGGAVLVDLVLAERCAVDGRTKRARVRLLDPTPTGSPAHDQALARMRPGREVKAATLVPRLGKGGLKALRAELVSDGALAVRRGKVLGLIPVTRFDVADTARQQLALARVVDVLVGRTEPDEVTGSLVSLLSAGNVVGKLVPSSERREAKHRAKEIAKGDWAGPAASAAIQAAAAAAAAATTAAVVAATSGGAVSS